MLHSSGNQVELYLAAFHKAITVNPDPLILFAWDTSKYFKVGLNAPIPIFLLHRHYKYVLKHISFYGQYNMR